MAANAAAVQLVACVTGTPTGAAPGACDYIGGVAVPIDEEDYTISVYAAQTGTQVGKPQTIDSDSTNCPDEITTVNGSTPSAFDATLSLSDVETAVYNVVSNPAS